MINIIQKPKIKIVKLFECPCGCKFTAETSDYTFCISLNHDFSYYTIECPICHMTYIYPYTEVKDISVEV